MGEYSGKHLLRETGSAGNEESRFPGSSLDESRRPTDTVSFISSSTRTGRCELGSAIGLYKQGRVNG